MVIGGLKRSTTTRQETQNVRQMRLTAISCNPLKMQNARKGIGVVSVIPPEGELSIFDHLQTHRMNPPMAPMSGPIRTFLIGYPVAAVSDLVC